MSHLAIRASQLSKISGTDVYDVLFSVKSMIFINHMSISYYQCRSKYNSLLTNIVPTPAELVCFANVRIIIDLEF